MKKANSICIDKGKPVKSYIERTGRRLPWI